MARQDIPVTAAPGAYSGAGALLTMTAADAVNKEQCPATDNDLIVAHNTGASPHTVTITSANDSFGRVEHITTESIVAGTIRIFGPFKRAGWMQSGQKIHFEADDAEVTFGVVRL